MAIKERKQITGTAAQIKGFAGHNGVLAYATDTKHLHVLSGTAGTTTELANVSDIPAPVDISGKADKTYVDTELAKKADETHTHTVSQITDMPNVVLSVNNITPASGGNVNLGLHAVAASGDYNDLRNKPSLPSTPSAYVTKTWKSTDGSSSYRKWSDGFIEQWGLFNGSYAGGTVTFPTQFSNINYIFVAAPNEEGTSGQWFCWETANKTTSSIYSGILGGGGDGAPNQSWYAAGF